MFSYPGFQGIYVKDCVICDLAVCRVITSLVDLTGTEPSPVLTIEEL